MDKILTQIENWILVISFLAITLLAFFNVVSRYVFHASLSWSWEIIVGLAVYLIMIGTASAIRHGAHPNFSALCDLTRGPLYKLIVVVIGLAMTTFMVLLLWLGWDMMMGQFERGRVTPSIAIPQWLLSLAIPVGALLGIIRSVQITILRLRNAHPMTIDILQGS